MPFPIFFLMLISLTGCSNDNETLVIETNNEDEFVQEIKAETSGDYTKWPSGVYNAYGIPEYTYGEVTFAVPYSEKGEVCLNTSITELRAYINLLLTKDFKISESDLKELNEYNPMDEIDLEEGLSGTIYAPTKGAGYTISYSYREEPNESVITAYSFENMTEDYTYKSNCSFALSIEEYPEENIEKDLLIEYGLTDEDVLPKFKVYVAEKGSAYDDRAVIFFDFGYDSNNSQEDINAYRLQIAKACEKISDDGKIYNYSGNDIVNVDDDFSSPAFVYKYKGVDYRVVCEIGVGLTGGTGCIVIENK